MSTRSLALGLDVGGSSVKSALLWIDDAGAVETLATGVHPLSRDRWVEDTLAIVDRIVHQLRTEFGGLGSIGVGLPGMFDASGSPTLLPNFPLEWVGYPVRNALEQRLAQGIHIVNDAKSFAIAESVIGAGKGYNTVACVVLGTGVGGGIVLGGELWTGQGSAGELGHITVEIDGLACGCGNHGCVEAYAGSAAIAEFGGRRSAEEVFAAAAQGDARALASIDRAVAALGAGLANVFITLAPEVFVVGGGVSQSADLVIEPLARQIRSRVRVAAPDQIRVVRGTLGRNAGAIGAALMASTHFAQVLGGTA